MRKAKCENCGKIWNDWLTLKWREEKQGNKLIPVEIKSDIRYGVWLEWPQKSNIPFCDIIIDVLNTALATEETIIGRNFELRNYHNRLGLSVDYGGGEELNRALSFYKEMFDYLFEQNFKVGNGYYERSEILRLSENKEGLNRAWEILTAVLTEVKDRDFAQDIVMSIKGREKFRR